MEILFGTTTHEAWIISQQTLLSSMFEFLSINPFFKTIPKVLAFLGNWLETQKEKVNEKEKTFSAMWAWTHIHTQANLQRKSSEEAHNNHSHPLTKQEEKPVFFAGKNTRKSKTKLRSRQSNIPPHTVKRKLIQIFKQHD